MKRGARGVHGQPHVSSPPRAARRPTGGGEPWDMGRWRFPWSWWWWWWWCSLGSLVQGCHVGWRLRGTARLAHRGRHVRVGRGAAGRLRAPRDDRPADGRRTSDSWSRPGVWGHGRRAGVPGADARTAPQQGWRAGGNDEPIMTPIVTPANSSPPPPAGCRTPRPPNSTPRPRHPPVHLPHFLIHGSPAAARAGDGHRRRPTLLTRMARSFWLTLLMSSVSSQYLRHSTRRALSRPRHA